jgi:hypothetical protein
MSFAATVVPKSNGVTSNSLRRSTVPKQETPYRPPVKAVAASPVATPVASVQPVQPVQRELEPVKTEDKEKHPMMSKVFDDPAYFEVYKKRCDELTEHFGCGVSDLLMLAMAALYEKSGLGEKRNTVPVIDKSMVPDLGLL